MMSKRSVIIPIVVSLVAFVLAFHGMERRHRMPAQRAAAPQALASTSAEGKPAQQATMSPSNPTPKRAYSEEEYNRLWQQYKPNQLQADGPLPADRLDLLAHTTRGNMDDQEMWPAVEDVIYGRASAVEE